MPTLHRVTLLTGDTVQVTTRRDGRRSISLEAGPDGTLPEAAITEVGKHAYVVPKTALPLLAAHRLDLDLFDVAALIDQRLRRRAPVDAAGDRRLRRRRRGRGGVERRSAAARTQDASRSRRSARPPSRPRRRMHAPSGAR